MYRIFFLLLTLYSIQGYSQKKNMTIETLWSLKRVGLLDVSHDGQVLYSVTTYNVDSGTNTRMIYRLDKKTGNKSLVIPNAKSLQFISLKDNSIILKQKNRLLKKNLTSGDTSLLSLIDSEAENIIYQPKSSQILFSKSVLIRPTHSTDLYPNLTKSDVYVFNDLNYRHWDAWEEGKMNHFHIANLNTQKISEPTDILKNEPYESPQAPFGGVEDAAYSADGKTVYYVCKKKYGKDYATSTNTDIFQYDVATDISKNITIGMMGYDVKPVLSPDEKYLAFTSMKTDGFEADKEDIILHHIQSGNKINLTKDWDGTVDNFIWSLDGKKIYFTAPTKGTKQVFEISNLFSSPSIRQVTSGTFDINDILAQEDPNELICTRTDMNRASEIYSISISNGLLKQLSHENDDTYSAIASSNTEARWIPTSDGKKMLAWIVYPPNFDPSKKYPTLLYCQGGPQSALSQFYSFRWNFQLMAAQGYIVICPNRRGMPGHGVEWNQSISGDWGGQPMRDYLAAVDEMKKESYVDPNRIGAVGASYGGYSVFMLAGIHQNRFKTFIAHCGLFDLKSWYGTTEELWFANYDIKGNYWDKPIPKSYTDYNPSNFVANWNTPIMIYQGGKDYRVPIEQGLQAFQAAQLKGIKSRLIYLPTENHWVMSSQNAIVWQKEFFKWLDETLK